MFSYYLVVKCRECEMLSLFPLVVSKAQYQIFVTCITTVTWLGIMVVLHI